MSQLNQVLRDNDPRLDEYARTGEILIGVFFPISTLAMILRLYSRLKKYPTLALDDYLAILAYVFWVTWVILTLWAGKNGGGWPAAQLPLKYNEIQLKVIYVAPQLTASLMTAAKFSILALYLRLFRPSRSFRKQAWVVGILCLLWWISAVFATLFQCIPVKAGWNLMERLKPTSRCADFRHFVVGIEIPNAILDYVVAGMAILVVRQLQMKLIHKIGLFVMFILCTVVAVLGLFRISITYNPQNYSAWAQFEWLAVQNAFVIICCCLPTYGVFLTKLGNPFDGIAGFFSRISDRLSGSHSYERSNSNKTQSQPELPDDSTIMMDQMSKAPTLQNTAIAEIQHTPAASQKSVPSSNSGF